MRRRTFAFRSHVFCVPVWLLVVWCTVAPVLGRSQTVSPTDQYRKLITAGQQITPLGSHPFGEQVSVYDGALSFMVTDISVPGTGPTLQLSRSFEVGSSGLYANMDRKLPFGDWDLAIPRIETYAPVQGGWQVENTGNLNRCTNFNPPPPITNSQGGGTWQPGQWWYGYHLIVPGAGSQVLLARVPSNTHSPTISGMDFQIVTKNDWMIACGVTASDGGEGFLAIAPDGTRYTFSHLVYRPMAAAGAPLNFTSGTTAAIQPMVATSMVLDRYEALMYVTKVQDRFGNTLTYNWSGNNLQSIVASDGRDLEFTYNSTAPQLIQTITLQAAGGALARTWTFSYNTSGAAPTLTGVQLPDGSSWSYSLANLQMATYVTGFQNNVCPGSGTLQLENGETPSGTITTPSGLTGTFTVQSMMHGRSYVPLECTSIPGASAGEGYPAIPNEYAQFSLTKEVISGPGVVTGTWTYSYSTPAPSWSTDSCASSNSCADTAYTDVVDAVSHDVRQTFSNRFDASEGESLSTVYYSGASSTTSALRSVTSA